jgi:uncharacterized protein GlcG (DUF336 family)
MEIEQIPNLTLGAAERLVDAALAAARVAAVPICVAVVDRAGLPLVFKRMPGAPLHSVDIALDKAYTAVSFGRPTGDWQNRLEKGSEMLRHGLMQRPRFVGFGGGLPVLHEGVRVGAIGISGGSEAQDIAFAESALAAG